MTGGCVSAMVLAAALAIDLVVGDPPNRWHPVSWLGTLIATARRRLAFGRPLRLLLAGGIVTVGVAVLAALAGAVVARMAAGLGLAGIALEAVALSCCLSVRGLWHAARAVAAALGRNDLAAARDLVGFHLVSRPTADLTAGEVVAATVESVAENLTDSIVAPALMYLVFGVPGAAVYRALNTADAMIGYREGVLEHFGKLAARADDVLNLIPARIAAVAIVVAAAITRAAPDVPQAAPARAWSIMWRDHARTSSPNAGWTMAAMAGALGVRLEKRRAYVLGDGELPLTCDIARALVITLIAAIVALLPATIIAIQLCR